MLTKEDMIIIALLLALAALWASLPGLYKHFEVKILKKRLVRWGGIHGMTLELIKTPTDWKIIGTKNGQPWVGFCSLHYSPDIKNPKKRLLWTLQGHQSINGQDSEKEIGRRVLPKEIPYPILKDLKNLLHWFEF